MPPFERPSSAEEHTIPVLRSRPRQEKALEEHVSAEQGSSPEQTPVSEERFMAPPESQPTSSKTREVPPSSQRPLEDILQDLVPDEEVTRKGKKRKTQFLAEGGENVVFDRQRWDEEQKGYVSRGSVVKIDYLRTIAGEEERDVNNPASRKALRKDLENAMEYRARQRQLLQNYYGFFSVPIQRSYIGDVPVNTEVYNKLAPGPSNRKSAIETETVPAIVTIQRKIELDPEKTVDITARYAEQPPTKKEREAGRKPISLKDYERAHDLLIGNAFESTHPFPTPEKERAEQIQSCIQMYPRLRIVKERMGQDEKFASQVRRFAETLVQYASYEKTPDEQQEEAEWLKAHDMANEGDKAVSRRYPILDLVGKHNIVFRQQASETWKPLFLDAMEPTRFGTIEALEKIAQKISKREQAPRSTSAYDQTVALNVLHYIRFVNALAVLTNIQERVPVPRKIRDIRGETWRHLIDPQFKQETQEQGASVSRAATKPAKEDRPTVAPPKFN